MRLAVPFVEHRATRVIGVARRRTAVAMMPVAAGAVAAPAPAAPSSPAEGGAQQSKDQEDSQDPEENPEESEADAPVPVIAGVAIGHRRCAGGRGLHVLGEALVDAGVVDADPDAGQQAHHQEHRQYADCRSHE